MPVLKLKLDDDLIDAVNTGNSVLGEIVVFILFLYVGVDFVTLGQKHQFPKGSDIYKYYCGNIVGSFYDYFSIAFIYMSYLLI